MSDCVSTARDVDAVSVLDYGGLLLLLEWRNICPALGEQRILVVNMVVPAR